MELKYDIVLRGNLITLWCRHKRIIGIHSPEKAIDKEFYTRQGWEYTEGLNYPGPEDKRNLITIRSKEEINNALQAAELTHRLSI